MRARWPRFINSLRLLGRTPWRAGGGYGVAPPLSRAIDSLVHTLRVAHRNAYFWSNGPTPVIGYVSEEKSPDKDGSGSSLLAEKAARSGTPRPRRGGRGGGSSGHQLECRRRGIAVRSDRGKGGNSGRRDSSPCGDDSSRHRRPDRKRGDQDHRRHGTVGNQRGHLSGRSSSGSPPALATTNWPPPALQQIMGGFRGLRRQQRLSRARPAGFLPGTTRQVVAHLATGQVAPH